MSTPFALAATLQLPGDSGLPADNIPFNASLQFTSLSKEVLNLSGSGTKSVGMGSISAPGALGIFIKVDPNSGGQPIQVVVNSSATPTEVSPGGCLLYVNPAPVSGITTISITYAASCVVRVWVLG